MNVVTQQLLEYIQTEVDQQVMPESIKQTLLENDWPADVIDAAFAQVGITSAAAHLSPIPLAINNVPVKDVDVSHITMDKIIEKFIPIAGALLLIVGFGYLLYANAWVNLSTEIRLVFGFFFSLVIIGGSFSLPEKMRYFTDIGIGSGVLLLYGTLIYGSRATELATAAIPEVVTLLTAAVFTVAVAYFASMRSSRIILILGMIGAYITPFVIGQNAVWVENVSFNAYLMYFFAVNVAVFLIGREISVRDIIPLNMAGLFIGVSTLWGLSASNGINEVSALNFFTSEFVTAILFLALTIFSIWSILLSAKRFEEKDDGYLSLGYIAPLVWFIFNISSLQALNDAAIGVLYAVISASCFVGWHVLLGTKTRFQHTALYAAGLLSASLAVFAFVQEFEVYTSILIAYLSLIFGFLYLLDSTKTERFISYAIVSLVGSFLALQTILEANLSYETLLIVIALLPAMSGYFIVKQTNNPQFLPIATFYSVAASIITLMFVLSEFIAYIDLSFLLFYIAPLLVLLYIAYINKTARETMTLDSRSILFRLVMFWFAFGFVTIFFTLVNSIYPAPTDTSILTSTDGATDWIMIKALFATIILFVGLGISRSLQKEQVIKRPSFILVIFGYSTLLLTGNYLISALMNDFGVSTIVQGGPRAIATTLWWTVIAIYLLYVGIKQGKKYHSEKLLGLILLGITLIKVILYDIANMEMQNKIIILMLVGGAMLLFSYYVRSKNLLEEQPVELE
jgi:hypothetical protein